MPLSPPSSASRLAKFALVLLSVTLALGATEFVLRRYLPVRGMIYELDERYLFRQVPGSRKLANPVGEDWPKTLMEVNEAGRRGDESTLPSAARRIVVYGDSFISAEFTRVEETYPAELERLLTAQSPATKTKVLNAGVTGYGIDQESLRIEDDMPALQPDVVIVATYAGNDFGDLLRNKLYRLDGQDRLVENVPVMGEEMKRYFARARTFSSIQLVRVVQSAFGRQEQEPGVDTPAESSNRTEVRLAMRQQEYESYILHGDNVVRNLLADQYDADVSLEPESPSARYRVRLMERLLERIRTTVEGRNARLLLLIIPERCDLEGSCEMSAERRRYPGYRPAGLTDAIESSARQAGVVYLNLFEPLRKAGPAGLYHPLDEHWNAQGQHLAAQLSARLIEQLGWLKSPNETEPNR